MDAVAWNRCAHAIELDAFARSTTLTEAEIVELADEERRTRVGPGQVVETVIAAGGNQSGWTVLVWDVGAHPTQFHVEPTDAEPVPIVVSGSICGGAGASTLDQVVTGV